MMKKSLILLILCFFNTSIYSQLSEKEINKAWCTKQMGVTEFRTKYGTYVDCLTDEYAVESEFDFNWKESIGQSLHYAQATERKAAILFIKTNRSKKDYANELNEVIKFFDLPIKVFVIDERLSNPAN